jgi:hypothetical protein
MLLRNRGNVTVFASAPVGYSSFSGRLVPLKYSSRCLFGLSGVVLNSTGLSPPVQSNPASNQHKTRQLAHENPSRTIPLNLINLE